jgi:hypothetical protein
MTKIKNRDITDKFITYFENDKPFTPSEKRMMGIKLAQVKKDTKAMLDDGTIKSDKSPEEIIMDAIEYAKVVKPKIRSMASLGFGLIPESIVYFEQKKKMELKIQESQKASEERRKALENNVNHQYQQQPERKKKVPDWLRDDL